MDSIRDISADYIDKNPDLLKVERSIPYSEFLYHSKARSKHLEYMILKRITETKAHAEYLLDDPQNNSFNRYNDIVPYRDTSVKISNGQYINASYISQPIFLNRSSIDDNIDTQNLSNCIIAAQGPMSNTAIAFWKMVWEQNVSLIIMCCNYIERDVPKCFEYLPNTGPVLYEDIEVQIIKETQKFEGMLKKSLVITETSSGEFKKLSHLHITGWEDNSVPDIKENFNALNYVIFMIQHKLKKHCGKVLVHCSAGIGRTGVIIGIYELVTRLERQFDIGDEPSISVFKTVRRLREQRWGMVATEEQYEFIYKFMEYWIANYIYAKEVK